MIGIDELADYHYRVLSDLVTARQKLEQAEKLIAILKKQIEDSKLKDVNP